MGLFTREEYVAAFHAADLTVEIDPIGLLGRGLLGRGLYIGIRAAPERIDRESTTNIETLTEESGGSRFGDVARWSRKRTSLLTNAPRCPIGPWFAPKRAPFDPKNDRKQGVSARWRRSTRQGSTFSTAASFWRRPGDDHGEDGLRTPSDSASVPPRQRWRFAQAAQRPKRAR